MFGAVKIKRNSDIDQCKYSGYGIRLDRKGFFSFGNETGRNAILFRVDMGSSPHIDNKKKNSLILGKCPTQELEHTLTPEKLYSINFAENNKKFCLSLHFNRANSYLFINVTKVIKFKGKDSEIIRTSWCLGNISKEFSIDNMKKTGLNGYVYDFKCCLWCYCSW